MKTKILKYSCLSIVIIGIVISSIFLYLYKNSVSPKAGIFQLTGLKGRVNIVRDSFGIPHINAVEDDNDAYFALGFAHAQDRMWQMEFQRHVAKGSLSELFGKATVKTDQYLRVWGFYRLAQSAWQALDPDTKAALHSYTAGINAFIKQGKLPLEYKLLGYKPELWTEVDSIVWQKMMAWNLQRSWEDKLLNYKILQLFGRNKIDLFQPPYPNNAPKVIAQSELHYATQDKTNITNDYISSVDIPHQFTSYLKYSKNIRQQLGFDDFPGKGSNSWVISGKLTATGKPILANDPHLQLSAPSLWYLAELTGPHLHVVGATVPGLPFVVIGHNDAIGWGVTDADIDAQDIYLESPQQAHFSTEIINVKGEKSQPFVISMGEHGPFLDTLDEFKNKGKHIALKWTAFIANDTSVKTFYKLNYARNWTEFTAALSEHVCPALNFTYADTSGNIGYYMAGKVPIRNKWSGELPLSANQTHEWQGFIPFKELPHIYNPPKGYVVSANNKIIGEEYPYQLTFRWKNPYRAMRITDLIQHNKIVSVNQVELMQNDTVSYLWQDLRETLLKTASLDKSSMHALKELYKWDGNTELNSISATIFAYWYKELGALMPRQIDTELQWQEPLFIKQMLQNNGSYCRTKLAMNCDQFLSHSLKLAMTKLISEQGENNKNWQWKNTHYAVFKALGLGDVKYLGWLWNRKISSPGGYDTVNVGSYNKNTFQQFDGAGYRQIIDFSNFDNSRYIISLGQSGNVFSSHYDDQIKLWAKGTYLTILPSNKSAEGGDILRLEPAALAE